MMSRATLLWMLLAVAAGLGLFVLKYEVQAMEERLVAINADTRRDLEAIHVLKAEWNYLNRPARLEELGKRLLSLRPVRAAQAVSIDDIPMRPEIPHGAAPHDAAPPAGDTPPPLLASFRRVP